MKFITVVDVDKIDEITQSGLLSNNYLFEMSDEAKSIISDKLIDLNVESNSVVNGYCLDGSCGDLSKLWNLYLRQLPVKTGDVIVQFGVESDECIFCDFNDFMEFNYMDEFERIKDIISYRFDKDKIAFTQTLDLCNFEKAFIVSEEWSKDDLIDSNIGSPNSSKLVTNLEDFKNINDSDVWRKLWKNT